MGDRPPTGAGPLTWVLRAVLALAALAAPIVTFRAFTDTDTPDPVRQQRLREAHPEGEGPGGRTRGTMPDSHSERRP